MRRPRQRLQVSTFPFLAVLLCAMGSLILLLLVIDKRAKIVARMKAWQAIQQTASDDKAVGRLQAEAKERREQDLRRQAEQIRRWAELERRRQALADLILRQDEAIRTQVQQEMHKVAAVAEQARAAEARRAELANRLQAERAELARTEEALTARQAERTKKDQDTNAARAELARLDATLREFERTLAELRLLRQQEGKTFSLVPYHGKYGDSRRPLYLECAGDRVIVHPGQKAFVNLNLSGVDLRTEVARRSATNTKGRLYVLFLVRPSGIETYYDAQSALEDLPLDFGYELIDADWELDFPDDNGGPVPQSAGASSQGASGGVGRVNGTGPAQGNGNSPGGNGSGPGGNPTAGIRNGPGGNGQLGTPGGTAGNFGSSSGGQSVVSGRPGVGNGAGSEYGGAPGTPGNPGNGSGFGRHGGTGQLGTGGSGQPQPWPVGFGTGPGNGTGTGLGSAAGMPGTPGYLGGGNGLGPDGGAGTGQGTPGAAGNRTQGSAGSPGSMGLNVGGSGNAVSLGPNLIPGSGPGTGGSGQGETSGNSGTGSPVTGTAQTGGGTSGTSGTGSPGTGTSQASGGSSASASTQGAEGGGTPSLSLGSMQSGDGSAGAACAGGSSGSSGSPSPSMPGHWTEGVSSSSSSPPPTNAEPVEPLPVRINKRDWTLVVECQADGVVLTPGGHRVALADLARRRSGDNPLAQEVRQIITRRKALRGPGETWDRPRIRFRVLNDGDRAYYLAYPALTPLGLAMAREDVTPKETDVKDKKSP